MITKLFFLGIFIHKNYSLIKFTSLICVFILNIKPFEASLNLQLNVK